MKALLTGAAGFVGRHMHRELNACGFDVAAFDSEYGYDAHMLWQHPLTAPCKYDLIVHCAYYIGGRAGIDNQHRNLARNLLLDAALFNWAVHTGQPRILYFSSSAVYPTHLQSQGSVEKAQTTHKLFPPGSAAELQHADWETSMRLIEEDARWGRSEIEFVIGAPDADYGYAKMVGERLAQRARAMGVNVHICRPFSGYGEDQNPDEYPFPAIVRRVSKGDTTVWGPVGQSRDWIHVDDVVKGALAVVDADYQEPVNLCTGIATEMGDLAQMVIDELKERGHPYFGPVQYDESKPTGVFYRVGDPTLMHQFYTPQVTLEEGIRRALDVIRP